MTSNRSAKARARATKIRDDLSYKTVMAKPGLLSVRVAQTSDCNDETGTKVDYIVEVSGASDPRAARLAALAAAAFEWFDRVSVLPPSATKAIPPEFLEAAASAVKSFTATYQDTVTSGRPPSRPWSPSPETFDNHPAFPDVVAAVRVAFKRHGGEPPEACQPIAMRILRALMDVGVVDRYARSVSDILLHRPMFVPVAEGSTTGTLRPTAATVAVAREAVRDAVGDGGIDDDFTEVLSKWSVDMLRGAVDPIFVWLAGVDASFIDWTRLDPADGEGIDFPIRWRIAGYYTADLWISTVSKTRLARRDANTIIGAGAYVPTPDVPSADGIEAYILAQASHITAQHLGVLRLDGDTVLIDPVGSVNA